VTDTETPIQPARLWKQMPEAKRVLAAEAFWNEREGFLFDVVAWLREDR